MTQSLHLLALPHTSFPPSQSLLSLPDFLLLPPLPLSSSFPLGRSNCFLPLVLVVVVICLPSSRPCLPPPPLAMVLMLLPILGFVTPALSFSDDDGEGHGSEESVHLGPLNTVEVSDIFKAIHYFSHTDREAMLAKRGKNADLIAYLQHLGHSLADVNAFFRSGGGFPGSSQQFRPLPGPASPGGAAGVDVIAADVPVAREGVGGAAAVLDADLSAASLGTAAATAAAMGQHITAAAGQIKAADFGSAAGQNNAADLGFAAGQNCTAALETAAAGPTLAAVGQTCVAGQPLFAGHFSAAAASQLPQPSLGCCAGSSHSNSNFPSHSFAPALSPTVGAAEPSRLPWNKVVSCKKSQSPLVYDLPVVGAEGVAIRPPLDFLKQGNKRWAACLAGKFLSSWPPFPFVSTQAFKLWGSLGLQNVFMNGKDVIMFQFAYPEARANVLALGP